MIKTPLPDDLSALITRRSHKALRRGALFSIETETSIIEEQGIPFIVRSTHNLQRKQAAQQQKSAIGLHMHMHKDTRAVRPNPFLPYDEDMYVCELSSSHICLLNKFNVVDQHILIVTKEYEPQDQLLSSADFAAVVPVLQQMDGLVFYNGGQLAGASQHHKHLQFIPKSLTPDIQQLPIETVLGLGDLPTLQTSCRSFPYPHAITRLELDWSLPTAQISAQLYQCYLNTCALLNIGLPEDKLTMRHYNLLLTRDWLLCVSRKAENFRDISLNSLAFAGSFFVRDDEQMKCLKKYGCLVALQDVIENNRS